MHAAPLLAAVLVLVLAAPPSGASLVELGGGPYWLGYHAQVGIANSYCGGADVVVQVGVWNAYCSYASSV